MAAQGRASDRRRGGGRQGPQPAGGSCGAPWGALLECVDVFSAEHSRTADAGGLHGRDEPACVDPAGDGADIDAEPFGDLRGGQQVGSNVGHVVNVRAQRWACVKSPVRLSACRGLWPIANPLPVPYVGHMTTATRIPAWTLGDRLAKARKLAGLSQQELADALYVSRNTVNNWENDHTRPSGRKVAAWALRTGVDPVWITSGHANTDTGGHRTTGWLGRQQLGVAA